MYFRIEDCIRFSFLPSVVYILAVLRTSHTVETIIWSLWWALITIIARVTTEHKTMYKKSPDWWETLNARLLFSSTLVSVLYACNVPYAWVGCFMLRASSYKTLSFVGFVVWSVLLMAGVCTFEYWPCLFLVLAMAKQWAEKERCDPIVYWARRSVTTFLHQEIRWCIWCKAVFPHMIRVDVSMLAWLITAVIMLHRWIMYIPPKKTFIYKTMPPTHVPAPSIETALACTICKPFVQIDDEERVYEKRHVPETKEKPKKRKKRAYKKRENSMFQQPAMKQSAYVQPTHVQQQGYTQDQGYAQHQGYTQEDVHQFASQYMDGPVDTSPCDFI